MKLVLNSMNPGDRTFKFNPPATFDANLTLDTAIDGSSTAGTMAITGKLTGIFKSNRMA